MCGMRPVPPLASRPLLIAATAAGLLAAACSKEPPQGLPPAKDLPAVAAQPARPSAPVVPPSAPAPHAAGTPTTAPGDRVGTVLETMSSGGYTYARLDLGGEEAWAAAPEAPLAVGAKVIFVTGTVMTDFTSNTLGRTFPRIHFVPGLPPVEGAGAPGAAVVTTPSAPGHAPPTAPPSAETIAPVAGGQTIAALLARAPALAGKPVVARGKVVKFNAGIMGRNWVHVHDGTADLTVTTAASAPPATLGDVVVVRGTLAVNKDFGAGYVYPVIVEDATLAAK